MARVHASFVVGLAALLLAFPVAILSNPAGLDHALTLVVVANLTTVAAMGWFAGGGPKPNLTLLRQTFIVFHAQVAAVQVTNVLRGVAPIPAALGHLAFLGAFVWIAGRSSRSTRGVLLANGVFELVVAVIMAFAPSLLFAGPITGATRFAAAMLASVALGLAGLSFGGAARPLQSFASLVGAHGLVLHALWATVTLFGWISGESRIEWFFVHLGWQVAIGVAWIRLGTRITRWATALLGGPLVVGPALLAGAAAISNIGPAPAASPSAASGTVLVLLSSAQRLSLTSGEEAPCGVHFAELALPLAALRDAGFEVEFASPDGRPPRFDEHSLSFLSGDELHRARAAVEHFGVGLEHPRAFARLDDAALRRYAGVFVPGGHAPVVDLERDPHLGRILRAFHDDARPTAAICHGVVALAAADSTYAGYTVTSFPRYGEFLLEEVIGIYEGHLPRYVDASLEAAGLTVSNTFPNVIPRVVVDREVITGMDPNASQRLADTFVAALRERVDGPRAPTP